MISQRALMHADAITITAALVSVEMTLAARGDVAWSTIVDHAISSRAGSAAASAHRHPRDNCLGWPPDCGYSADSDSSRTPDTAMTA